MNGKFRAAISPQMVGNAMVSPISRRFYTTTVIEHLVKGGIDSDLSEGYKQSKLLLDMEKRANDGNIEAMEKLAEWYKHGLNGLMKDQDKYIQWKTKANDARHITTLGGKVKRGNADAMYDLGQIYELGLRGVERDESEAYSLYQQAADLNHTKAMALTALSIISEERGKTTEKQKKKALVMMTSAAWMGSDYACFELGEWFMDGKFGLPETVEDAEFWLQKVVDGSCKIKHLEKEWIDKAKEYLLHFEDYEKVEYSVKR